MNIQGNQRLNFENVWKNNGVPEDVIGLWKLYGVLSQDQIDLRAHQLVYVVRNESGSAIGVSTAFKAYIKQLRNYFYAFRCMLIPEYRIPGLTSKLVVMTRDFLESIHEQDEGEKAIGVITLVENERIKQNRREAIWPASKMVYIGNSGNGSQIRVYYFKGARISP
ncbi:MAG: hypothetical protein ACOYXT_27205 [Bacteroidota bacterium]